jgi:transposase
MFEVIEAYSSYAVPSGATTELSGNGSTLLHCCPLMSIPGESVPCDIVELRAYIRQRERLLDCKAEHIQHMQQAIMKMNVQLHHVVADVPGKTGMEIIRAIVASRHNPEELVKFRDCRCKNPTEVIIATLTGNYIGLSTPSH